jgi:fructosamine-3-kinase
MFQKEAHGLIALRHPKGPIVPEVFLVGENYLLLEDLQPSPQCQEYWTLFGRQLAEVHLEEKDKFGFDEDNYIGSNPQANPWTSDGWDFFREHRIIAQMKKARDASLLASKDIRALEKLIENLPDLIPEQPPSLIHGDLWSGNMITDQRGWPAFIDPAAHYGWAEAELAMMNLFGSVPGDFYTAYQEIRPLEPGFNSRYPLYNLYHLLNHLNLFGRGYLAQVQTVLSRFN